MTQSVVRKTWSRTRWASWILSLARLCLVLRAAWPALTAAFFLIVFPSDADPAVTGGSGGAEAQQAQATIRPRFAESLRTSPFGPRLRDGFLSPVTKRASSTPRILQRARRSTPACRRQKDLAP
jgi:hypothetical protein